VNVGNSVGAAEGFGVGTYVGEYVGESVGIAVGTNVGTKVGDAVGLDDGYAVGLNVGLAVGFEVGTKVGESVASAEQHSVFAATLDMPCPQLAISRKLQHCPGSKPHTDALREMPSNILGVSWRSFRALPVVLFVMLNNLRLLPVFVWSSEFTHSAVPPLSLIARIRRLYDSSATREYTISSIRSS
jgi:hypothetical protein